MQRVSTIGLGAVLLGAGCEGDAECLSTSFTSDWDGDGSIDWTDEWTYDEQGRMLTWLHSAGDEVIDAEGHPPAQRGWPGAGTTSCTGRPPTPTGSP